MQTADGFLEVVTALKIIRNNEKFMELLKVGDNDADSES